MTSTCALRKQLGAVEQDMAAGIAVSLGSIATSTTSIAFGATVRDGWWSIRRGASLAAEYGDIVRCPSRRGGWV
jgi:hypothetical protein